MVDFCGLFSCTLSAGCLRQPSQTGPVPALSAPPVAFLLCVVAGLTTAVFLHLTGIFLSCSTQFTIRLHHYPCGRSTFADDICSIHSVVYSTNQFLILLHCPDFLPGVLFIGCVFFPSKLFPVLHINCLIFDRDLLGLYAVPETKGRAPYSTLFATAGGGA